MTKEEFIEKMVVLLDEYEESNNNIVVGCYLALTDEAESVKDIDYQWTYRIDTNITHEWNGKEFATQNNWMIVPKV